MRNMARILSAQRTNTIVWAVPTNLLGKKHFDSDILPPVPNVVELRPIIRHRLLVINQSPAITRTRSSSVSYPESLACV